MITRTPSSARCAPLHRLGARSFFSRRFAFWLPHSLSMPRRAVRKLSTNSDPTLPSRSSRLGPQSEGSRRREAQSVLESVVQVVDAVQRSPVPFPSAPFHSLLVPTMRRAAELSTAAGNVAASDNSSSTRRNPVINDFVDAVTRFTHLLDQGESVG